MKENVRVEIEIEREDKLEKSSKTETDEKADTIGKRESETERKIWRGMYGEIEMKRHNLKEPKLDRKKKRY